MKQLRTFYKKWGKYIQVDGIMYIVMLLVIVLMFIFYL